MATSLKDCCRRGREWIDGDAVVVGSVVGERLRGFLAESQEFLPNDAMEINFDQISVIANLRGKKKG